jgi:hypothetical protein
MPMFRPLVGGKEAFIPGKDHGPGHQRRHQVIKRHKLSLVRRPIPDGMCSQGCRSAAPADRVVTC